MDIKSLSLTRKDKPLILSSIITILIVYGYSLFNFTLSIDNEFTDFFYQKISIGRWGGAFLKELILPDPYSPFFTHFVFCFFLLLSAVSAAKLLGFNGIKGVVFSCLCLSFPSMFYQADFVMQSDAVSIGIFVGVMSAGMAISSIESNLGLRNKLALYFISIILYCLSISVYQSIFNTAIGIVCLYYASKYFDGYRILTLKKIAIYSSWVIASLSLYLCLTKAIQSHYSVAGSSYLINQIGWLSNPFDKNITTIYNKIWLLFSGDSYFGSSIFKIASVCFIIHLILCIWNKKGVMSVVLSVLAYLSPFILVIALASDAPPRTFTFQPFTYAFFIASILYATSKYKVTNYISTLMCVISVWSGSIVYTRLMFSDYMMWQSDKMTAAEIISTIRSKIPEYKEGVTPIYFHGALNKENIWKPTNSDIFGSSFFAWDGGNSDRIIGFYRANLIATIYPATLAQAMKAQEYIEKVNAWPSHDSVFIKDGVVVVKLNNNIGYIANLRK